MSKRTFGQCYSWGSLVIATLVSFSSLVAAGYFDDSMGKTVFAFAYVIIPHAQNVTLKMF